MKPVIVVIDNFQRLSALAQRVGGCGIPHSDVPRLGPLWETSHGDNVVKRIVSVAGDVPVHRVDLFRLAEEPCLNELIAALRSCLGMEANIVSMSLGAFGGDNPRQLRDLSDICGRLTRQRKILVAASPFVGDAYPARLHGVWGIKRVLRGPLLGRMVGEKASTTHELCTSASASVGTALASGILARLLEVATSEHGVKGLLRQFLAKSIHTQEEINKRLEVFCFSCPRPLAARAHRQDRTPPLDRQPAGGKTVP